MSDVPVGQASLPARSDAGIRSGRQGRLPHRIIGVIPAILCLLPGALAAQAAADSAAVSPAVATAPRISRASWLTDRRALNAGDIVTIVVDEQTSARERVSKTATADRGQRAEIGAGIGEDTRLGPAKAFSTGHEASSRDIGEAGREGDLVAVLSVRVVAIEPNGNARIQGHKTVMVDGRAQEVTLEGVIRPDDVTSSNLVSSSRIADAMITYKGKKIGPKQGIIGKILSILWP